MEAQYSGAEKRKHSRFEWRAPVTLTHGDTIVEGEILNISLGGILVNSSLTLKYGDKITAKFSVPKLQEPIVAECTVRWISGENEGGLNFIGLKAIETWAVNQLLRQFPE
ncbi:MAG: PilZ domain-containing protein [Deltaproteobacteria bacterium]|nr:PilZ domain-containing protein [Deltaproteobacteria bacterium]